MNHILFIVRPIYWRLERLAGKRVFFVLSKIRTSNTIFSHFSLQLPLKYPVSKFPIPLKFTQRLYVRSLINTPFCMYEMNKKQISTIIFARLLTSLCLFVHIVKTDISHGSETSALFLLQIICLLRRAHTCLVWGWHPAGPPPPPNSPRFLPKGIK